MPWHTVKGHSECTDAKPWAVVKDSDGSVEGCHATEDDANKQVAALYANEPGAGVSDPEALGGKPNPGTEKDRRLKANKRLKGSKSALEQAMEFAQRHDRPVTQDDLDQLGDEDLDEEIPEEEAVTAATKSKVSAAWHGTIAVEGVTTGDQREFSEGALTWADPPIPLRWKKEDAHGGQNDKTVAVGSINKIWRSGNRIEAEGEFDLGSEDGQEAHRRMSEVESFGGISIDADDITDADVEMIWPADHGDGTGDGEGDLLEMLFASPDKILFHAGRIRAATLVDIPAFVEAAISLTADGMVTAGGVGTHSTATSAASWDGAANEKRLDSPMPVATARKFYAWVDEGQAQDGKIPKSAGKFGHHEVSADGTPGAANLTACSSGIAILNGGRGGTNVSAADKRTIYAHLAAHLRDAGREPPELNASVLEPISAAALDEQVRKDTEGQTLLSAGTMTVADLDRPPREWFTDPRLSVPMNVIVTDEGRVYGHAAHWDECHIGHPDVCVTAPYEESHPYFMTGELVCSDGSRVEVGQITLGTGHAPLAYSAQRAAEHYDNTGSVVADVAIGNDKQGIWVAGAVRPGTDEARVRELRASGKVSGDWRRIAGSLRLVGLLGVNVAGFQTPQVRSRVACGQQLALVSAGMPKVGSGSIDVEKAALRLLMDMQRRQIHGEEQS